MVKDSFDKGELKHELAHAGFQDCVVEDIAERVNDHKRDGWTKSQGRTEAMHEIEMFINRSKQSYDNFKESLSTMQEQTAKTT